jgi:hypothetical protein
MAPTRESLLNTVRALLEMTEARGCTAPEAALARSKAVELIGKYGITLRDLSGPLSAARVPIRPRPSHSLDPKKGRPFNFGTRNGIYSHDAFVKKACARKAGANKRSAPNLRGVRLVTGYCAFCFAIGAVAIFQPAKNFQRNSFQPQLCRSNVFEVAKPLGPFNLGAEEARYLHGSELLTSSESR